MCAVAGPGPPTLKIGVARQAAFTPARWRRRTVSSREPTPRAANTQVRVRMAGSTTSRDARMHACPQLNGRARSRGRTCMHACTCALLSRDPRTFLCCTTLRHRRVAISACLPPSLACQRAPRALPAPSLIDVHADTPSWCRCEHLELRWRRDGSNVVHGELVVRCRLCVHQGVRRRCRHGMGHGRGRGGLLDPAAASRRAECGVHVLCEPPWRREEQTSRARV